MAREKPREEELTMMQKLAKRSENGLLCVEFSPDPEKFPQHLKDREFWYESVVAFVLNMFDAVSSEACLVSVSRAFFTETALGGTAIRRIVDYMHKKASAVPVVFDAEYSGARNNMARYAREAFEVYGFDAVTVNPYGGCEKGIDAFLRYENKGVFIVCRTPHKGTSEFQDLALNLSPDEFEQLLNGPAKKRGITPYDSSHDFRHLMPFYEYVACRAAYWWNTRQNCGLVIGGLRPLDLRSVRMLVGEMPILYPGMEESGTSIQATIAYGANSTGIGIHPVFSSSIIHASSLEEDDEWLLRAKREAAHRNKEINACRLASKAQLV